jgi:hypothetical protein
MKLILENWRKYLNEGVPVNKPIAKPVLDITGKGSNELGDPHEPGSIAWKITNNLVTPCTSSADCAEKKKDDPRADQPWESTEDWSDEEYGQWFQENEESVEKANFDINQFLAVKKHGPKPERWENFFDEQMEFVNSAVNQKQADDVLRQVRVLLDRQEELWRRIESGEVNPAQSEVGSVDEYLWKYRWPPEKD